MFGVLTGHNTRGALGEAWVGASPLGPLLRPPGDSPKSRRGGGGAGRTAEGARGRGGEGGGSPAGPARPGPGAGRRDSPAHLCSRPEASEWPGSLAAPTRRSGPAPAPPPSSRLRLRLRLRPRGATRPPPRAARKRDGPTGGRCALLGASHRPFPSPLLPAPSRLAASDDGGRAGIKKKRAPREPTLAGRSGARGWAETGAARAQTERGRAR